MVNLRSNRCPSIPRGNVGSLRCGI